MIRRNLCAALTLISLAAAGVAQAQQVAITLDDLPYVLPSRTTPAEGLAQVAAINRALAEHGITATGFAVGAQLTRRSRPALQSFADAGHTIGNHSWSHPDYGTLTIDAFRAETVRTHAALTAWIGDGPRLYRFPFLREGETPAAKAAADQVLGELGYRNVPVTIDNDEWRFNADYLDALDAGDARAARQIAAAYLTHMQERTQHFQDLARSALDRDVAHILLLHMNRLNADHLDTLLAWYAAEGWTFITVEEALKDPLFEAPERYTGPRGLSQIERVIGRTSD
ncbi:MAG: polysaccharide deacetylase family protein [Pseudomonadota bacterium]